MKLFGVLARQMLFRENRDTGPHAIFDAVNRPFVSVAGPLEEIMLHG